MKKSFVLSVLAATSLAACASSPDASIDDGDPSALTSGSGVSMPQADERSCFGDAPAGYHGNPRHVRVEFLGVSAGRPFVRFQFYDAATGYYLGDEGGTYGVTKSGDTLVFGSSNTDNKHAIEADLSRDAHGGYVLTARSSRMQGQLGNAPVPVACDLDATIANLVKNPKAPHLASSASPAPTSTPSLRPPSACLASAPIASGKMKGAILRAVAMTGMEGSPSPHVTFEAYDPATGFVLWSTGADGYATRKGADGKTIEVYDTGTSDKPMVIATLGPKTVGGSTVMAAEITYAPIAAVVGGVVPINCDFLR